MNEKQIKNTACWAFSIVIVLISGVIGLFIYNFYSYPLADNSEKWGQFGDYIGGTLNPILAFLSFSALLFTIYIQVKQLNFADEQLKRTLDELNLSRTELALTRTELQRSADAQTGSKQVMEQQLLTQSTQQFDSIFFAMLNELNSLLIKLEEKNSVNESLLERIYVKIIHENINNIEEQNRKLLNERELCKYFILLYQLLKIIDQTIENNTYITTQKFLIKKNYSNILRACISEKVMQLLMVNVLNKGFEPYKNLVEKFSFFEHASFYSREKYNFFLINIAFLLKDMAFGNSQYYLEIKQSNLYGNYIVKTKSLSLGKMNWNIFSTLDCDSKIKKTIDETSLFTNKDLFYIDLLEITKNNLFRIYLKREDLKPFKMEKILKNVDGVEQILERWECETFYPDTNSLFIAEQYSGKKLINLSFGEDGNLNYEILEDLLS